MHDPIRIVRAYPALLAGFLESDRADLGWRVSERNPLSAKGWLTLGLVHFAERHLDPATAALEK